MWTCCFTVAIGADLQHQLGLGLCSRNISFVHMGKKGGGQTNWINDIFRTLFLNAFSSEDILIQISLKFVPKGPNDTWVVIGSGNGLVLNWQEAII